MTLGNIPIAALCMCLVPVSLPAQESRFYLIGVRMEAFPSPLFTTTSVQASTTKPVADYSYTATSDSPKLSLGPSVEFRLSDHFSLGPEFRFHHAEYRQIAEIRSGRKDPNSAADDRQVSTITETSKANYWEVPLLAHYYFLRPEPLARIYLTAGMEYRHVGKVRTGNEFVYADGTVDYNEIPAQPNRTNQIGFVIGVGLRFVSHFHLRTTPELRYIQWQGATFQGVANRSARNQVEFGLGFSF